MQKKVAVLGHFAYGKELANGQTIKTKIVTNELARQLGEEEVLTIDTHGGVKSLLKAPFQALKALRKAKNVIIFPAHNGVRIYGRLFPILRKFFKARKLHYVVIGGWLPDFLKDKMALAKKLKKFDGIYVETNTMKNALEAQGFENVFIMPNCKELTVLKESDLVYYTSKPYKLCTFSRVMKEKGIEDAINVVSRVNKELESVAFSLDIYGPVDSNQIEWFETLKNSFPDFVRYCGTVPFDSSVEILKDYFALLFPTYYEGEGFAGTLIDALSAGLPVVATDWRFNSEIVNEDVGYTFHTGNLDDFVAILKKIASSPEMISDKKQNCLKEVEKYKIDKVVGDFVKLLI